ncbi:helix-turn-helix transcriptional regulator [Corallococcus exiguus]|nr:helix-turn-helix transcriptional regulator [Corallococcus exiguus]
MKLHSWKGMRREKFTPAQLKEQDERVQKELLEMSLREVREFAGMTQTQLAERMGISQGQLSQTEARDDHRLSTLRARRGGHGRRNRSLRRLRRQANHPQGRLTHDGPPRWFRSGPWGLLDAVLDG